MFFFKKWAISASFIVYFRPFQTNINIFYNNVMWKNVHPVSGAGIRTHDILYVSLLP